MVINYHDRNLVVMYLQIFLKERFGLTVKKVKRKAVHKDDDELGRIRVVEDYGYEITRNDPIKVTGYYNTQTYSALALYMAYNYPNEGYPYEWKQGTDEVWRPFDYIDRTQIRSLAQSNGNVEVLSDKELIRVISTNMENLVRNPSSIQVPERVLSYIFNEVVTPSSSPEEIIRIKKLLVSQISPHGSFEYRKVNELSNFDLFEEVVKAQEAYIKSRTPGDYFDEGTVKDPKFTPQFKDFKVTGYVDPWTEIVLKGGIEYDE